MNIVENIEPMAEDVSLWSSVHVSTAEHSSGILRGGRKWNVSGVSGRKILIRRVRDTCK